MATRRISTQLFLGVLIILVGVALLLQNLGAGDVSSLFKWIPSLFILLGLWQLLSNGFRFWTGPLILIVGGLAFQLAALELVEVESILSLWPLLLIIIGVSIMLGRSGTWSGMRKGAVMDSAARVNVFTMFGGDERVVTSQAFEGGEVTAVFGGATLRLDKANVTAKPAVLNVFSMFGGVGVEVSPDWLVERDVLAIFGGVSDKRRQRKMLEGEPSDLRITGFVAFGGLDIKPPKAD